MAIKTPRGYRVISGVQAESLDVYIQAFSSGSGQNIILGSNDFSTITVGRGSRTTDGAGAILQMSGGQAKGTNQAGGDINILTGYSTGNAASGSFSVKGDMSPGSSGDAVNSGSANMLHLSGSTGDATFYNDIIIGGDEITNAGSDNDLILTSDKDMYFTLDRDVDSSGNKFVFRKHGTPGFTEIAELDEDGNLQIDGRLTTGLAFTSLDVDNINLDSGTIKFDDTAHNVAGGTLQVKGGSTTAGTTNNIAGGNLDLYGGAGKGTGDGGIIRLLVAPAGSSGSTLNSYIPAVIVSNDFSATFIGSINATSGVSGNLSGTATNATKQIVVTNHNFFMNSSSTTVDFFFPYNNLNEANSTNQYYTRTIAPYDGRIVKVLIRPSAGIGTACKLQFHKITDTTLDFGTAVEEVTSINLNTAETSVSTAFSSATFSAGNVVNVSLIKSDSATANIQAVIVWEYTT